MSSPAARLARFPPTTDGNPYQRLLYSHLSAHGIELVPDGAGLRARWLWRARREVTHLHFHWRLDRHYRPPGLAAGLAWPRALGFVARLALAKALGLRLVWTIHELVPKDRGRGALDRAVVHALARLSDVMIAHDRAAAERARRELGGAGDRVEIVPHGSYIGIYPAGRSRDVVRAELGLPEDAFAFLCFGSLRRYKRVERLLEAFARLERRDVALVVAGQPRDEATARAVAAAAEADPRIVPRIGFVADQHVAELFGACDAAVVPRTDGWTSGSLILSMSMGLPAIAADVPAYRDLIGGERGGWLFDPGDPTSLTDALEVAASDVPRAREKGAAAYERAETLRWPDVASRTAAAIVRAGPSSG